MLPLFAVLTAPFAFFGFWESTLAAGAAAASIPIIIHLLNRRRYQVVTWAAMRFLLNAQKKNTRRMRLEQLILLALRTLLIILLVIAMASVMPWAETVWAAIFPDGAGFLTRRASRSYKIIVVDGSLSMAAKRDSKTNCFDYAQEQAVNIVNDAQPGDGFSVLLVTDDPEWKIGKRAISYDASEAVREIKSLREAHGNGNMLTALKMVADKLSKAPPRLKRREVYFITDLQRTTWQLGGGKDDSVKKLLNEIQDSAMTVFVDVSDTDANNLAVTDLSLSKRLIIPESSVEVIATVQNFGDIPRKQLPVKLYVGRGKDKPGDDPFRMIERKQINIPISPGQEPKAVRFPYTFTKPGTYAIQVRIGNDDLRPDNSRTTVITVKETIPILLVNGKPAADPFDTATEYLKVSLNPFTQGPIPKFIPFRPKVMNTVQFGNASETKLSTYDCIFLCDVGLLTTGQVRRLKLHLKRGGGVIIGMGKEAADNLERYNTLMYYDGEEAKPANEGKGILPAKFTGVVQAPPDHFFTPLAEEAAYKKPPLKAFSADRFRTSLMSSRFQRYVHTELVKGVKPTLSLVLKNLPGKKLPANWKTPAGDSKLLVSWNPPLPDDESEGSGRSAGLQSVTYPGKVILMTSTWNVDWNSWAGSPSFGPMVQELTREAVAGRLHAHSGLVGQPLKQYLLSGGAKLPVNVFPPGGSGDEPRQRKTIGEGEITLFYWPATHESGVYRMTVGQDQRDHLFAVNVPTFDPRSRLPESDLDKAADGDLKKLNTEWQFQIVRDLAKVRYPTHTHEAAEEWTETKLGPEIARLLLLVVLGLMILEVVLAWAFGHFTSVPGASTQQNRVHPAWPVTTAVVASVLFVTIFSVLAHAAYVGDFLGFLPDTFRSWVETSLNIEQPASGEGTKWDLEFTPYLVDAATDWWMAAGVALGMIVLLFLVYRREGHQIHPAYKAVLGGLRFFLVLLALVVLLPQLQLNFKRQGWPHVIILVDDSLSMGESDQYKNAGVLEKLDSFSKLIIRTQLDVLQHKRDHQPIGDAEQHQQLKEKIAQLKKHLEQPNSSLWQPNRLQLAQALLKNDQQDWLAELLKQRKMKIHLYHLDSSGKALQLRDPKGKLLNLSDPDNVQSLDAAHLALARLEPYAKETMLGTALRQILVDFRGSSVAAIVVLSDGITTASEGNEYDKNLETVSRYADFRGVPLYLVGIGDDHELRDLKLHDLMVPDTVYVHDQIVFEALLTGKGYTAGKEVEVKLQYLDKGVLTEIQDARIKKKIDPSGKPVPLKLKYRPTQEGLKTFIIEVVPPETGTEEKISHTNLKLQRTIRIIDPKESIDVLYVEQGPRYEFRFVKTLVERESEDKQGNKSMDLRVVLMDADPGWGNTTKETKDGTDAFALKEFPQNKKQLEEYEVIIFGDVDPQQLGEQNLRNIADFVREQGGGLLVMGGPLHNPHSLKDTPLEKVLPIDLPAVKPPPPGAWKTPYHLELTAVGNFHPIFRFSSNMEDNLNIWRELPPMYWHAQGYQLKPLAEVLAVHSNPKLDVPLAVQHFVGAGRCMFFGFDESWRWQLREDQKRFNQFWIQTLRYLSRNRVSETKLRLDRQTSYRTGEKIKVTVTFPDNQPPPKQPVKVLVQYFPPDKGAQFQDIEKKTLDLAKVEGSWATYEAFFQATREGRYKFRLTSPLPGDTDADASKKNDDPPEPPSAEAVVIRPPGELDKLRMNREEMETAARYSGGKFYTLADANKLLSELPSGYRVILNTEGPPQPLWNHWLCFLLILGLLTSEWLLRKRKHLL